MLDRFINVEGFQRVPWTGNRYFVNVSGEIMDIETGLRYSSGNNDFLELWSGTYRLVLKRSVIVALVFKVSTLHVKYWTLLDTVPLDGNEQNTHASNLIWKYPKGGLKVSNNSDFCFIPGLSRYSINTKGELWSHVKNRLLSPYTDVSGYWMYGVQPDVGRRTVLGMHRLLGLAFLTYPADVSKWEINHKDGVKKNNSLINLEWVTCKNNIIHAVSSGLRTDNVPVLVMNSFTKEVTEHYSLESCGLSLGMDGETIRLRAKTKGQVVFPPGLQFKIKNDETPWKFFDRPELALIRQGLPRSVIAKHVKTGNETKYKTISDCAAAHGLEPGTLNYRLQACSTKPSNNHVFRYEFNI